nr:hypothetical protein [Tanacetum cinerariifolium]
MSSDKASYVVTYTSILSDYKETSDVEQASLSLDYVPGPKYSEYLAPSDEENNMPLKRISATTRAAAVAAAPMTAAAVEQLIEARVSAALANHETLRNSINGHGDGSHNYHT